MTFLFTGISAQTVKYGNVRCSVAKQDSIYSLVVTVKSSEYKYLSNPTMLIRTFGDKVIKLQGTHLGDDKETTGILIGSIMCPVSEISTTAQFRITPEQFEQIKDGVKKVRLSMTPKVHEKEFSKDKIGSKLYNLYLKTKDMEDDF